RSITQLLVERIGEYIDMMLSLHNCNGSGSLPKQAIEALTLSLHSSFYLLAYSIHLQMCSYACQQFPRAKWLDQVIIGSRFHAFNAGFFPSTSRKQNHRQGTGLRIGAESV